VVDNIGSAGVTSAEHSGHESARLELRGHVRAAWADALQHDRFGDDDDFFDIGGHSLLVADIMARLGTLTGRRLRLRLFFDNPTVGELAGALAAGEPTGPRVR
jgi:hypothetical protein